MASTSPVDAKQAAQIAAKYYKELTGEQQAHVTLEEVEFDDASGHWLITLGLTPIGLASLSGLGMGGVKPHAYKIFRIDAQNGEVRSMKIRDIRNP